MRDLVGCEKVYLDLDSRRMFHVGRKTVRGADGWGVHPLHRVSGFVNVISVGLPFPSFCVRHSDKGDKV